MGRNYVFSEQDYLKIKRDHQTLERMMTNLRSSISRFPRNGHKGRSAPHGQLLQIYSEGATDGDLLLSNADSVHPGRIRRLTDTTWASGRDVWIRIVDWDSVDSGLTVSEHSRYFSGNLSGTFTSGGTTKPLYVCDVGEQTFLAKADSALAKGDVGTFSLYHRSSEIDSLINVTAQAIAGPIAVTDWCTVERVRGGQWYGFARAGGATSGTPFYNDSGASIPPFAMMFIGGDTRTISGTRYIEVGKPGGVLATFDIHWLVNGASTIPAAGFEGDPAATGTGSWLSETNGGLVAVGEAVSVGYEFGPAPGSWYGWRNRPGFTALESSYTDANGNYVVQAKQRDVTRVFGRMYSDLTQNVSGNATAQFEIWHRNASTGFRFPAGWDLLTVYAPLLNVNETAKAGTLAFADYMTSGTGYWEVDPACDQDNTNSAYPPGQSSWYQGGLQDFQAEGQADSSSGSSYAAVH